MLTLHQKCLTESQVTDNKAYIQLHQNLRQYNPSKFLNDFDQLHDMNIILQSPKLNDSNKQIQPIKEKDEITYSRFPKIQLNSNQSISKPFNTIPQSKHNQLKSQLQSIFSQQNFTNENHIVLPGLQKQRKESQMFISMIEQQVSFQNQDTQTSRSKRFQRQREQQTQSQTYLNSKINQLTENSQLDDSNTIQKKVEFYKSVKVINLENGNVATESIKEEDEQKSPKKSKRKFVSKKTKFYQADANP